MTAILLDFALGKALEDAGNATQAFAVLQRANRAAQRTHAWDAPGFLRQVQAIAAAFASDLPTAPPEQSRELVFLVGLPRSGTTLVKQVLASHSKVEGASELPYLRAVIDEESQQRRQAFPAWVS